MLSQQTYVLCAFSRDQQLELKTASDATATLQLACN